MSTAPAIDFAALYGQPTEWTCPDCGCLCTIYPALPFQHECKGFDRAKPRTAFYYYRLKDDDLIAEFIVCPAHDPNQTVETLAPDGTVQRWRRRRDGDKLVFTPPDSYAGNQGIAWRYDQRLQRHMAAPRHVMEREALGNRVSISFPAN